MHRSADDARRHQDGMCCNDAGHCPGCESALREDNERQDFFRQEQRRQQEQEDARDA